MFLLELCYSHLKSDYYNVYDRIGDHYNVYDGKSDHYNVYVRKSDHYNVYDCYNKFNWKLHSCCKSLNVVKC